MNTKPYLNFINKIKFNWLYQFLILFIIFAYSNFSYFYYSIYPSILSIPQLNFNGIFNLIFFVFNISLLCFTIIFATKKNIFVILFLITISLYINIVYNRILYAGIDYDKFIWLVSETNELLNALIQYRIHFIKAFVICAVYATAIYLTKRMSLRKSLVVKESRQNVAYILYTLNIIVSSMLIYSDIFPRFAPINELNLLSYFSVSTTQKEYREKPFPQINHKTSDLKNIVLVVDESVSYESFNDIKDSLLQDIPNINYGVSYSSSNCSAGSNANFRWMANPIKTIAGEDVRENPKLWSMFNLAGYKTFFFDGQTVEGKASGNFLSGTEESKITHVYKMTSGIETDRIIAVRANTILKNNSHQFLYLLLKGAHVPYEGNYPSKNDVADSKLTEREKHHKAVEYSKNNFFKKLTIDLDLNKTLIVYTSDHGQLFREGAASHCNVNNFNIEEYKVPLILITSNGKVLNELKASYSKNLNHSSHFQILPTLAYLAGYDINDNNGKQFFYSSLLNKIDSKFLFHHQVFPEFNGAKPEYVKLPS